MTEQQKARIVELANERIELLEEASPLSTKGTEYWQLTYLAINRSAEAFRIAQEARA